MPRQSFTLLVLALACALRADAQNVRTIQVPRGEPITVDGRIDDAEWRTATRIEHPAGTVVRIMRDADHLFLGITSERPGFASLCVAAGDEVHVLHASAALGAVTYRRVGDSWRSVDTAFVYGMRNTALDSDARVQRATYLREHGWLASTVRMGNEGRAQEMQISLGRFPTPFSLALGRWLFTNSTEWWPSTITDHDGCFNQQLVTGYVPQGIAFKTSGWINIEK